MKENKAASYEAAGVSISTADSTKQRMAQSLKTDEPRVLNQLGAFASLYDGSFPELKHPVLVMKMEEPGSKQMLAIGHRALVNLGYDLINHLINDIVVMGATPLAVLDAIICGKLEKEVVVRLVESMAQACKEQGAVLVGGETSEQPGVLEAGRYILSASILGVADRDRIIDGSSIKVGDALLAVASNGLHTNGYSLIRKLLEIDPPLAARRVGGESFLDVALRSHTCYWKGVRAILALPGLHGLAHITGGGIEGNLPRILPDGIGAEIDLALLRPQEIFSVIKEAGNIADGEMLRTFNVGVGLIAVVEPGSLPAVGREFETHGYTSYPIGRVISGNRDIIFSGRIHW